MKKSLIAIFCLLNVVVAFLFVIVFSFYTTTFTFGDNSSSLFIERISPLSNKDDFYNDLKEAANKENLNIYKIDYPQTEHNKKSKVIIYAHIVNQEDFFKKMSLKSGRLLNDQDSDDCYLSSNKKDDPNCVGVINWFDGTTELEIRPLSASKNDLLNGSYGISTQDDTKINSFINTLNFKEGKFYVDITKDTKRIQLTNSIQAKYILVLVLIFVCATIILCSIILVIYNMIFRFKEISIKILNGFKRKTINIEFLNFFIKHYFLSWVISMVIIFISLIIYNGLNQFLLYMFIFSLIILLIFLIIFVPLLILTPILIKYVNVSKMIRNKKPIKLIKIINSGTKAVLSISTILVLTLLVQNLNVLTNQFKDLSKWEFTKNYCFMRLDLANPGDELQYNNFCEKCKSFFDITNKEGAILMKPCVGLLRPDVNDKYYKNMYRWQAETNSISINNNYLKINSIYGVDGNKIVFNNETEDSLHILIPQKYYSDNQTIEKYYKDYAGFLLKTFEQNKPEKLDVDIIYVKDNQNYFSMNPTCGADRGFTYTDPVAIVYNNISTSEDTASSCITQGYYYTKIGNPNNPMETLQEPLKQSGLDEHLITAPSLYNFVSTEFYNNSKFVGLYAILSIISLTIFLIIILVSTINYIDENKLVLAVEKIHGFSFLPRHLIIYIKSLIMWGLLFSIASIFFSSFNAQYITLFLAVIDIAIKTIVIKIKELKKTKDILKGD